MTKPKTAAPRVPLIPSVTRSARLSEDPTVVNHEILIDLRRMRYAQAGLSPLANVPAYADVLAAFHAARPLTRRGVLLKLGEALRLQRAFASGRDQWSGAIRRARDNIQNPITDPTPKIELLGVILRCGLLLGEVSEAVVEQVDHVIGVFSLRNHPVLALDLRWTKPPPLISVKQPVRPKRAVLCERDGKGRFLRRQ